MGGLIAVVATSTLFGCRGRYSDEGQRLSCGGVAPFYDVYQRAALDNTPGEVLGEPLVRARVDAGAVVIVLTPQGVSVEDCQCTQGEARSCTKAKCVTRCRVAPPPVIGVAASHLELAGHDGEGGNAVSLAEAYYGQGRQAYESGEFVEAARAWAAVLEILPENRVNRETRDTAVLLALGAYRRAFEAVVGTARQSSATAPTEAKAVFDAYDREYRDVYGERASVSLAVRDQGAWVNAADPRWDPQRVQCPAADE